MIQNDWKEIRWNEGLELFDQLVQTVKDYQEQEWLSNTIPLVSKRLADATWITPNN